MYKLVIDLEMNGICTEEIPMGEIIEIGAVILNDDFEIIREYNTYVKPINFKIANGVQTLTHITIDRLLTAPSIEEALRELLRTAPNIEETTLYTWSDSDTNAIISELSSKEIHIEEIDKLCEEYIDIQKIFGRQVGIENRINLTKALNMIGLEFTGKEHGALADAINTAQVLKEIETSKDVRKTIDNINSYMTSEPLTSSMASLFSNIKLN